MEPIVNRVAQSDIVVFNLEELWDGRAVLQLDIAPLLDEGLILREIPFRESVKKLDTAPYEGNHVAVYCSSDAIVPVWAYMLVTSKLAGVAASVGYGSREAVVRDHFMTALDRHDWSRYAGKNVVVKGCGSKVVPEAAYVEASRRLQSVVQKLMFGEPCSSVPLWRRPSASRPDVEVRNDVAARSAGGSAAGGRKLPPGF